MSVIFQVLPGVREGRSNVLGGHGTSTEQRNCKPFLKNEKDPSSFQNEPLDGNIPDFSFNCMGWNASTQSEFVAEHLGPAMEEAGYGDVEIMIFDDQVSEQKGRNENCSRVCQ